MSNAMRLAILFDQTSRLEHALTEGASSLGRYPENSLVFQDALVSRHHAVILYCNGRFFIQDLGSRNGTLVNGERLESLRLIQLKSGDLITMGRTSLTFVEALSRQKDLVSTVTDTQPLSKEQLVA